MATYAALARPSCPNLQALRLDGFPFPGHRSNRPTKLAAWQHPRRMAQRIKKQVELDCHRPGRSRHCRRQAGIALATSADRGGVVLVEPPEDDVVPEPAGSGGSEAGPSAKLVAVVGADSASPFSGASWQEVMQHMVDRLAWIEPGLQLSVFSNADCMQEAGGAAADAADAGPPPFHAALGSADVLLAVDVHSPDAVRALAPLAERARTFVCFDSDPALVALTRLGGTPIGGIASGKPSLADAVKGALPWCAESECARTLDIVEEAWGRRKADDVLYVLLVLVDAYVAEVPMLKNLRAGGPESLQCMIKNCGPQVVACFMDPGCRAALGCLGKCAPTDQVCSYRCIVSYESPLLEAFSLCILQKHNCLGLSAEVRMRPEVNPMTTFRGEALTFDTAERIFTGWLNTPQEGGGLAKGDEYAKYDWSWRVTAGQNAAYDQFPCQYQLYYKGKARGSFWYDPVFQVRKFDGETVWRRRHYRVRRAKVPGTFWLSVLDNGVISKEFWRIVDCTDDFSWALFYYSGAAANVGQAYTGAILVTPEGAWPAEDQQERLLRALDACGIKPWELYRVDNSCCVGAPLGYLS